MFADGAQCGNTTRDPSGMCHVNHRSSPPAPRASPAARSADGGYGTAGPQAAEAPHRLEGELCSRKREPTARQRRLKEQLERLFSADNFQRYLKARSRMHNYSWNNALGIFFQRPDATLVLPRTKWEKLGRTIKDDAEPIFVVVPRFSRRRAKGGESPGEGSDETEPGPPELVGFRMDANTVIFDIADTEGADIDDDGIDVTDVVGAPPPDDLDIGAVTGRLEGVAAARGLTVEYRDLPAGYGGYWDPDTDRIVVSTEGDAINRAHVLAHELAHAHDPVLRKDPSAYRHHAGTDNPRGDAEFVAESAACMVMDLYGVDTSEASARYMLQWRPKRAREAKNVWERADAAFMAILDAMNADGDGAAEMADAA